MRLFLRNMWLVAYTVGRLMAICLWPLPMLFMTHLWTSSVLVELLSVGAIFMAAMLSTIGMVVALTTIEAFGDWATRPMDKVKIL